MWATPVILAAGPTRSPTSSAPTARRPWPVLVGSIVSGLAAYVSVRFLVRWFTTRTLTPFGIYSLVFGAFCLVRFW